MPLLYNTELLIHTCVQNKFDVENCRYKKALRGGLLHTVVVYSYFGSISR